MDDYRDVETESAYVRSTLTTEHTNVYININCVSQSAIVVAWYHLLYVYCDVYEDGTMKRYFTCTLTHSATRSIFYPIRAYAPHNPFDDTEKRRERTATATAIAAARSAHRFRFGYVI